MKNLRRIALEYEFIVLRQNGSSVDRKDILGLWRYFIKLGWKEKRDQYNKELVGVYRNTKNGKVVIDNDGGACLLEIAWAPHNNLHAAKNSLNKIIELILKYFKQRYRLIGYGTAPFTNPYTVKLTPKSQYPLFEATARPGAFRPFFISGAGQFNLDGNLNELLLAENIFSQLAGTLTALSANSSIYQNKITKHKETRQYYYDILKSKMPKYYQDLFGIPTKYFSSWQQYFLFLLSRPALLLSIDGKLYEGRDKRNIIDILKKEGKIKLREFERKYFLNSKERDEYKHYQREELIDLLRQAGFRNVCLRYAKGELGHPAQRWLHAWATRA